MRLLQADFFLTALEKSPGPTMPELLLSTRGSLCTGGVMVLPVPPSLSPSEASSPGRFRLVVRAAEGMFRCLVRYLLRYSEIWQVPPATAAGGLARTSRSRNDERRVPWQQQLVASCVLVPRQPRKSSWSRRRCSVPMQFRFQHNEGG